MNMKITLIRHGKTLGNEKKVYLGLTDESLSNNGKEEIIKMSKDKKYPLTQFCYVSPMKRCLETMNIIYKDCSYKVIDNLIECNFGDFEYKTYNQLKDNENYIKWLETNGEIPFPNGESKKEFSLRSVKAFESCVNDAVEKGFNNIAIICHGGTIMSVMECFEETKKDFYNWQVKNGEGFILNLDEEKWQSEKTIVKLKKIETKD